VNYEVNCLGHDGFAVYLNGQAAGSQNLGLGPNFQSTASIEATASERVRLSLVSTDLVAGENTIAVQVHRAATGNDIYFDMELIAIVPSSLFLFP